MSGSECSSCKHSETSGSLTSKTTMTPTSRCRRVSLHVKILWVTLSIVVTASCSYSFTQPQWFVHYETKESLGMYTYCVRDMRTKAQALSMTPPLICCIYGGQFQLSNLPSNAWQIGCVLFGGGCVLLLVGSLASVVSLCLPSTWSTRFACYTGYIQTMAAVILVASVTSFPVGLDSKFAKHYCPGAKLYWGGTCQPGWAYILAVMSTALSIFCPFLSQYTDFYEDSSTVPLISA